MVSPVDADNRATNKADKISRYQDGTSIYMTRDLGGAKERKDAYKFDKAVYVVAAQQDFYFKQLFKTLDLMGYEWADPKAKQLQHINFGR
jgi:arginyl-tRNA synthetase